MGNNLVTKECNVVIDDKHFKVHITKAEYAKETPNCTEYICIVFDENNAPYSRFTVRYNHVEAQYSARLGDTLDERDHLLRESVIGLLNEGEIQLG